MYLIIIIIFILLYLILKHESEYCWWTGPEFDFRFYIRILSSGELFHDMFTTTIIDNNNP